MRAGVREASVADVGAVSALDRQLSPVFSDELSYRRFLGEGGLLVVAEAEGTLLGFAALSHVADEASLLNLAVIDEARRHGCATRLLGFAAALLESRSVRRVLLDVRESNDAARELYLRCGFREDGRRPSYYRSLDGAEREAAILMSQSLSGLQAATAGPGA